MKLFISHASEDQKDFVLPLAEALKPEFDVWFAPWMLVLGDPLLQKIDQALASSDYGIVVLSPSFFAKKWPRAELDGLFALETKNKKVILPVWKDLDEAGVAAFSPILASRYAALASDGVDKVVMEIKKATGMWERAREISQLETVVTRFTKLGSSIEARMQADKLLQSPKGAQLVQGEVEKMISSIKEQLKAAQAQSPILKFEFPAVIQGMAEIWGNGVGIVIELPNIYMNSAHDARLRCTFCGMGKIKQFVEREPAQNLEELNFKPDFGPSSEVLWLTKQPEEGVLSTAELTVFLLERFYSHIEKRNAPRQR
jgi:TIR domain